MITANLRPHLRNIALVLLSLYLASTACWSQGIPRSYLTGPIGNGGTSTLTPADLLAGPVPLQGSSALGITLVAAPNPWGVDAVIVVDIFSPQNWVYDAVTLAPLATVPNPSPAGSTTTGITTDGDYLYWGVFSGAGNSQLWRSEIDGGAPSLIGSMDLQGGGFVGGLAWDGSTGIWAVDITGDRYDLISLLDASYLGASIFHPDGGGSGNGIAWRSDCGRLEVPHGPEGAGRVTTISTTDPLSGVALAPMQIAAVGFFINGIESSRSPAAQLLDPFGVYSIWIVDNSTNSLSVIEGRQQCPQQLPGIIGLECLAMPDTEISVNWQADPSLDSLEVRIDGLLVALLTGSESNWSGYPTTMLGVVTVQICGNSSDSWTPTESCELVTPGCSTGSIHLSHLAQPDLFEPGTPLCGNGAGHEAQSYWRIYEACESPFSLDDGMGIESVRVAVENSDPGPGFTAQPVVLRLYSDPDGGSISPINSLDLIHEQEFLIPRVVQRHFCLNLETPIDLTCDLRLVVELALPDGTLDGHLFLLGSNSSAESEASWISAAACGSAEPTPLSDLGFPDAHIGLDLIGNPRSSPFIRGDINTDGLLNLTDPIGLLDTLFVPGTAALLCQDAADCNDDGSVNLADAIYLLSYLFIPGSPQPADPDTCGADPTAADPLNCDSFAGCP